MKSAVLWWKASQKNCRCGSASRGGLKWVIKKERFEFDVPFLRWKLVKKIKVENAMI